MDCDPKSKVQIKASREKLKATFQIYPLTLGFEFEIPQTTVFRNKEHPQLFNRCMLYLLQDLYSFSL